MHKFVSNAGTASSKMVSSSGPKAVMLDLCSGLKAHCQPMILKGVPWTTHSGSNWEFDERGLF